jgi:hypothetical protein
MRVQFALFDGDALLERGEISVTGEAQCSHLTLFHVGYQLQGDIAKIVLSNFAPSIGLNTANLDMPVHQSSDWESIDLATHTFAFRCSLDV